MRYLAVILGLFLPVLAVAQEQWEETLIIDSASRIYVVGCEDIDADSDMDIYIANDWAGGVRYYEQTQNGWIEHQVNTSPHTAWDVCAADMDLDGDFDIIGQHRALEGKVTCWEYVDGSWIEHIIITPWADAIGVAVGDVDSDGYMDVLGATPWHSAFNWWENDGTPMEGPWIDRNIWLSANGAHSISAADLDGDGDTDVTGADYQENRITWYENDGTPEDGGWVEHVLSSNYNYAYRVICADASGSAFCSRRCTSFQSFSGHWRKASRRDFDSAFLV